MKDPPDTPVQPLCWQARGEHELPATEEWLTVREREYVAGIRFTKRRTEFLLRRWTGKCAVASALDPGNGHELLARIEIANHPSGAPYALLDGAPAGVEVSLSDRAGWAVCVVGSHLGRLGIDLEIVEPRSSGFVADFLTPAEQAYVTGHPDPHAAANLVWSAKEAGLKVLQTGLRRDTRSVEIVFREPDADHGWGELDVHCQEGPVFPGWWRRDGLFLVTVAAEQPMPAPDLLEGSGDLAGARPVHSWTGRPVVG
jgi:4'-phosphopantetheinyl transferase